MAAVEYNYREVDRQLKEQFIHGLNDKCMLEDEGMLAWAKRVEVQRAQTAVLYTIMESRQFDKVRVMKKTKEESTRHPVGPTSQ